MSKVLTICFRKSVHGYHITVSAKTNTPWSLDHDFVINKEEVPIIDIFQILYLLRIACKSFEREQFKHSQLRWGL